MLGEHGGDAIVEPLRTLVERSAGVQLTSVPRRILRMSARSSRTGGRASGLISITPPVSRSWRHTRLREVAIRRARQLGLKFGVGELARRPSTAGPRRDRPEGQTASLMERWSSSTSWMPPHVGLLHRQAEAFPRFATPAASHTQCRVQRNRCPSAPKSATAFLVHIRAPTPAALGHL